MVSSRSRSFRCEGIVLRHADLGEADRLLTILTPDRGIVRAVAKGARKPTSKTGGHVDLLRRVSLSINLGRSLPTIGQAETVESYAGLRTDLERASRGMYIAELAERFSVEDVPAEPIFECLAASLGWLQYSPAPDLLLRWFELRLLLVTGFMPEVGLCADCRRPLLQRDHVFSVERGGLVCPECRPKSGGQAIQASVNTIKVLRHLARTDWPEAESLRVEQDDMHQVERIVRAHIRNVADHVIKSTRFLDEVRQWRPISPTTTGTIMPPA